MHLRAVLNQVYSSGQNSSMDFHISTVALDVGNFCERIVGTIILCDLHVLFSLECHRHLRVNGIQPLLTAKRWEESLSIVAVHPAVEKGIGKGRAHGNDVEHSEDEFVFLQVQDVAVNVNSKLEGMEGQPADCKHHHHSSKASILQCSAFFLEQFSHPYMTTGKNHSFDYTDFVSKVMSLLFNMLSRLVIAFLPRRKCLLISWLQSPLAVILEPKKRLRIYLY